MMRLEGLEVVQRFRKPGGDEFALFINKLIRSACWAGGIPQSAVSTSSRTDAKDKGVDTRLECAIPGDRTGYLQVPTIWQFKAAAAGSISQNDIEEEVEKERSKQWITDNYGYRLCVCDHLTDDKKQTILGMLAQAISSINPNAPPAMVLSVDDLAEVANTFPALVLEYRPHAEGICILFDPWSQSARGITETFVPPGNSTPQKRQYFLMLIWEGTLSQQS